MTTKTIEQFFTGKNFVVPSYQRDYAWSTSNIDDLFEDISEAMDVGSGHYLGAFILSNNASSSTYGVVDGQQRLTTLTMLLDAMVSALSDVEVKTFYRSTFVRHPLHGQKFTVLGDNQEFFRALLAGENPVPDSQGQRRLQDAYSWIRDRVAAVVQAGGQQVLHQWLACIAKMEVLEFVEPNEGKAIRMFQSVNDRGVPLSRMDIAKSLLVYYSNRFLGGELDSHISAKFGEAFRDYDLTRQLAAENGFEVLSINRAGFREDDLLRYHYLSYNPDHHGVDARFDYSATAETVLDGFLKPSLKMLRLNADALRVFVREYVDDMAGFFAGFRKLVQLSRSRRDVYLLLVIGNLNATLFPLVTRLISRDLVDQETGGSGSCTLLELIEMVDVRVFKIRGTTPQADVLSLSRDSASLGVSDIASGLIHIANKFMDDGLFASRVSQDQLYKNLGLKRILYAVEDSVRESIGAAALTLQDLVALEAAGTSIEHIFPQEPSFGLRAYQFKTREHYEGEIHKAGNLTLLEGSLNSSCRNQSIEIKVTKPELYRASGFEMTRSLAAKAVNAQPAFSLAGLESRSVDIANVCLSAWPLIEVS